MTRASSQEYRVSGIRRTGWRRSDRLVELIAEAGLVSLQLSPKLALDLALRLLQPERKKAAHAAVGIRAYAAATSRTDEGDAVLSFVLPGDSRLSVVLTDDAEQQLLQGLASRPRQAPPPRKH